MSCCMQSGLQEPTDKLMRDEIMTMLFAGETVHLFGSLLGTSGAATHTVSDDDNELDL